MRSKAIRRNRLSNWGTTEEFNARVARRNQPSPANEARRLMKLKSPPDRRVLNLYKEVKAWNEAHPRDLKEVDHIRPVHQGGLHVRENLRVISKQSNRAVRGRSEEDIQLLLKMNLAMLGKL